MLVCNYFFFSFLLRFLFYGIRRGVNGVNGVNEALFGVLGVLVGVVLFGSGRQSGASNCYCRGIKMVICGIVMVLFRIRMRS